MCRITRQLIQVGLCLQPESHFELDLLDYVNNRESYTIKRLMCAHTSAQSRQVKPACMMCGHLTCMLMRMSYMSNAQHLQVIKVIQLGHGGLSWSTALNGLPQVITRSYEQLAT